MFNVTCMLVGSSGLTNLTPAQMTPCFNEWFDLLVASSNVSEAIWIVSASPIVANVVLHFCCVHDPLHCLNRLDSARSQVDIVRFCSFLRYFSSHSRPWTWYLTFSLCLLCVCCLTLVDASTTLPLKSSVRPVQIMYEQVWPPQVLGCPWCSLTRRHQCAAFLLVHCSIDTRRRTIVSFDTSSSNGVALQGKTVSTNVSISTNIRIYACFHVFRFHLVSRKILFFTPPFIIAYLAISTCSHAQNAWFSNSCLARPWLVLFCRIHVTTARTTRSLLPDLSLLWIFY